MFSGPGDVKIEFLTSKSCLNHQSNVKRPPGITNSGWPVQPIGPAPARPASWPVCCLVDLWNSFYFEILAQPLPSRFVDGSLCRWVPTPLTDAVRFCFFNTEINPVFRFFRPCWAFEGRKWCKLARGRFFPPGYESPAPKKTPKIAFVRPWFLLTFGKTY